LTNWATRKGLCSISEINCKKKKEREKENIIKEGRKKERSRLDFYSDSCKMILITKF
jgi:hypothetical protein